MTSRIFEGQKYNYTCTRTAPIYIVTTPDLPEETIHLLEINIAEINGWPFNLSLTFENSDWGERNEERNTKENLDKGRLYAL